MSSEEIGNVEVARNGKETIEKIERINPDVLILDLMMPEIDGITVFKFLSEHYPIPTIIFSAHNPDTLEPSVQTLLMGAFDFISKPQGLWEEELPKYKEKLISSTLYAGKIKKTYETRNLLIKKSVAVDSSLDSYSKEFQAILNSKSQVVEVPKEQLVPRSKLQFNAIVIGTSTGGPKTLKSILKDIPKDFNTPILIVQHLDPYFMKELSKSLNQICNIEIKIPENGEKILPGKAYLSPGGKHMEVTLRNNIPCIKIFKGKAVNFCMPSVDVLFLSAAKVYKNHTLGILLTGLGEDGAVGLEAIKNEGGTTIAESEQTCIVYGMPKAAVKRGAASFIIPNYEIKNYMVRFASRMKINISN